jgi:sulfite exporter TauE/SafE
MILEDQNILISTAALIAFIHTLIGPDHYLIFAALGKARDWSMAETLKYTSICSIGHILSSVIIGFIGIFFGIELAKLVNLEEFRGLLSGWVLLFFGLIYFVWGLRKIRIHKNKNNLSDKHSYINSQKKAFNITPWALFIVFVLGPCEALIPLFMYPAIETNMMLVFQVALVFGIVTLLTMLLSVFLLMKGLNIFKFNSFEKYSHVIAGASIMLCALAINITGL